MREESVIINKDKVYTSYYARACRIVPDSMLVAISIGIPNNFKGQIYRELNPSHRLLYAYKAGQVSDEEYTQIYINETLSRLSPEEVYQRLKGKVALCYCGKGKFCHRIVMLNWLCKELGTDIIGGEL